MQTDPTVEPRLPVKPPPSPAGFYCACAVPHPVERATHCWAAQTYCERCGLPVPVRWSRV